MSRFAAARPHDADLWGVVSSLASLCPHATLAALCAVQSLALTLFPLHFFFHFLFYTDVGSVTFTLAAYLVRSPANDLALGPRKVARGWLHFVHVLCPSTGEEHGQLPGEQHSCCSFLSICNKPGQDFVISCFALGPPAAGEHTGQPHVVTFMAFASGIFCEWFCVHSLDEQSTTFQKASKTLQPCSGA